VTLVVDEANIAFKIGPDKDQKIIRETRAALQYFTMFTKEETKVRP
jgi:hypothetical protein